MNYDDRFLEFIDEVYQSDLMNVDYFTVLSEKANGSNYYPLIPTADQELLTAILTFFVRGEKFCDGTWASAIKQKEFLSILKRLKELE